MIWVDADACPVVIKEILFRAAARTGIKMVLVANHAMRIPPAANVSFKLVGSGFDVADNHIVQELSAGDLVITADIPLAAEVIEKGGLALNPRGQFYTTENIRQRLNMRDFMESLRSSGIQTGGPSTFSNADKMAFANQLDKWLVKFKPA
ncbi:YaiI/YqxD family protein [Thiosulfativibrio zosterae]|uniref:UPF0178 protein THMIRHAT_17700 n=1 Tax=Thiosulfativibrio zosterae TaxID=2675053 RepID=A0A6F8PPQ4_9GAMM|nr:YaiI/YqxD family protein [Thiosulfativibrio zosterae]BBP44024.1 UPF0178 protein [Thiosulfativibrio zosterae]